MAAPVRCQPHPLQWQRFYGGTLARSGAPAETPGSLATERASRAPGVSAYTGPEPTYWILVTASREWADHQRMNRALVAITESLAVPGNQIGLTHGDARGGDRMAAHIARCLGWLLDPVPCTPQDWQRYGPSAGHRRNAVMVARHAYRGCVAFPLGSSPGTRGCIRLAQRAGIPVWNCGVPA